MNEYNKALNDARRQLALLGLKYAKSNSAAHGAHMYSAVVKLSAKVRTIKEALKLIEDLKK